MTEPRQRPGLPIETAGINAFCSRWNVIELALFGSVLRENFGPESDVDVLVTFAPDAHPTLFDLERMREELELQFGRSVDLLTRREVEQSRNAVRRQSILASAELIHAA